MKRKARICNIIAWTLETLAFIDLLIVAASIDGTPFMTCLAVLGFGIVAGIFARIFEGLRDDYEAQIKWRIRQRQEIRRLTAELQKKAA